MRFRKDAHAFPEALGNRYLLHPEECDECNDRGSVLEDALSKHLTLQRAVARIRGKGGPIKHRLGKRPASIGSSPAENLVTVELVDGDDSIWATRTPTGIRYHARIPSYRLADAARAIARVGIFLAPAEILPKLDHIRRWVRREVDLAPVFREGWVPGPGLRLIRAGLDVNFPDENEHQALNFLVSISYGSTLLWLELPAEDGTVTGDHPPPASSPYPPHQVRWSRLSVSENPVTGREDWIEFTSPALKALPPLRHEDIAVAAYFRAASRDFAPGSELDDWLAAEQDLLWGQVDGFAVSFDDQGVVSPAEQGLP